MSDKLPITLAAGSGPTFGVDDLACAAATFLGFWEDEGLEVTWIPVHGGVAAMDSVLKGESDVSYGGLGPVLRFRSDGQPVRVVVSMARALAQNLVTQKSIASTDQLTGISWALDGIGALSHHMARLVVGALNIPESEIDWKVLGPPPERIEQLLTGDVDVSLIRVEEALSLSSDDSNALHTLLGFAELKDLVPVQPHGVLATLESYEQTHGEELHRLTRGMMLASRALNDDFEAFRKTVDHHVSVAIDDDAMRAIWEQEQAAGSFAVDGELTADHWSRQMELFYALNPDMDRITFDDVIAPQFVAAALDELGHHIRR